MRLETAFTIFTFVSAFYIVQFVLGDPTEECNPRNQTYHIADSKQCDKYWACGKNGKGKVVELLCEDGFVFSDAYHSCDYPHNVDCTKRPQLQPAQSIGDEKCARLNGFYEFPPEISCQKFYHCLEGTAYEKTCPEGIIFDRGTCVHPDMSARPDCAAHTVLDFKCPNMNKRFERLRFGDHDRFSHPKDCRKFFICLMDGKPRLGGCPLGKVFNNRTGFCDNPRSVPSCEDYYGKKTIDELLRNQAIVEGLDVEGMEGFSSEETDSSEKSASKKNSDGSSESMSSSKDDEMNNKKKSSASMKKSSPFGPGPTGNNRNML